MKVKSFSTRGSYHLVGFPRRAKRPTTRHLFARHLASVFALLMLLSAMPVQALAATSWPANEGPQEGPPTAEPVLDGDFNGGDRKEQFRDESSYALPMGRPALALPIPEGAHDSVEVDLSIFQDFGYDHGTYGVRLHAAVTPHGQVPASHLDYVVIFDNYQKSTTLTAKDMRLTWDLRIPRDQVMDLHLYCETIESDEARSTCSVSNIRGFSDTGEWKPFSWNGPKQHAWGVYSDSMPLVVVRGALPMGPDGAGNPFLGMERSGEGYGVSLRSPLVTLPTYTDPNRLMASVRWQRTVSNTTLDPSCKVMFNFVALNSVPRGFMAIPAGVGSGWETLNSPPFPLSFSGKTGFIEIQLEDCAFGKPQAVGIDSLKFSIGGQPVQLPLVQCDGRTPTIVGTDQTETIFGTDGPDVIVGRAGNDIIYGSPNGIESTHPDVICGGDGYDTLTGSLGNDRIFGEGDRDIIQGSVGNDFLAGGTGHDDIDGHDGDDHLEGNDGNDLLMGSGGTDYCDGGSGTNEISLCENLTLPSLIDTGDLEGFRIWASERSLANINAEVANLDAARRGALAELVLDTNASEPERVRLLRAMNEILSHPDMGFYAEIWGYTEIRMNDGGGHNASCGFVNLDRGSFAGMPDAAIRDLLMHESLHSFNCVHHAGNGAFDEGSAVYIFKAAFPDGRHAAETFAEATYGTKLWYRDMNNQPDYPMQAPDNAGAKALELFRWLSEKDNHQLPWNSTERLHSCYAAHYESLSRNVDWETWLKSVGQANENMAADPNCRPL